MLRDLLREAYGAMRHNRRRTALTMLGMAWGIATVVMLLAYGDGFGQACANIFANFGTKLVIVIPGKTSACHQPSSDYSYHTHCRETSERSIRQQRFHT
jgi:hypothetical protein